MDEMRASILCRIESALGLLSCLQSSSSGQSACVAMPKAFTLVNGNGHPSGVWGVTEPSVATSWSQVGPRYR